jgi:hypothetical protein
LTEFRKRNRVLSEGIAASVDCICGHSERDHTWASNGRAGISATWRCGYAEPLPRVGDEACARWLFCGCQQYVSRRTR